uniref:Myelin basic protein n=1 Tax=Felis catus TaxID=9685 RepID=A0ABI7VTG2_FELCA
MGFVAMQTQVGPGTWEGGGRRGGTSWVRLAGHVGVPKGVSLPASCPPGPGGAHCWQCPEGTPVQPAPEASAGLVPSLGATCPLSKPPRDLPEHGRSGGGKAGQDADTSTGESSKRRNPHYLSREASEDSDVFGEADVEQNNGAPSQDTAVTDSKRTADPKNAWQDANPADPGGRPHLIRLFSRDAPGREDNTFKDRPSESDELQTIQEDSTATPEGLDVMASQKRPSQRHGSKYLASASAMDHARHGFLPRHRDTGILDSLGRFFGGDRGVPKRGSGKVSSEE